MLPYDDIARSITAHHLSTPIADAEVARPGERAGDIAARLGARAFDHAPVVKDDVVLGYVRRSDLESKAENNVLELMRPVGAGILVSTNAQVRTVLEALVEAPFIFVVEGRRVSGFVVYADMNRHAARTYFYLLVADLELALGALLRKHYSRVRPLLRHISARNRRAALMRFIEDRARDVELDELSAVAFNDVLQIVGRSPRTRRTLGCVTEPEWVETIGDLNTFRNAVMHPNRAFVGRWSAADLLDRESRLQGLLQLGWRGLR